MYSNLTLSQKSAVYNRVDHFVDLANAEYGHNMSSPHIRFDKRGTCGGTADSNLMELNFNAGLMLDNWDEYMNQVVPHEVAHLVKAHVFGSNRKGRMMSSHGGYWKQVMRVFGIEPDRCHSMDTSKFKQFKSPVKKFMYVCEGCQKEIVLTAVRHNRLVRGTHNYQHCRGSSLIHKKSLGSMSYAQAHDHKTPKEAKKPVAPKAPKQGTKIAHAMVIFQAMVVDGIRLKRQDIISALENSMQITRQQAAGYYQNCKKKAA